MTSDPTVALPRPRRSRRREGGAAKTATATRRGDCAAHELLIAAAPAAKRRAPAWSSSTEPGSNANAGSATQRHAWPASRNGLAATPAHGRPPGTIASYLPATYATPAA